MESYSYYLLLNHLHFCSLLCLFILFYSSVLMNTVMFYLNNKYFCILNSLHSKCFFFFFSYWASPELSSRAETCVWMWCGGPSFHAFGLRSGAPAQGNQPAPERSAPGSAVCPGLPGSPVVPQQMFLTVVQHSVKWTVSPVIPLSCV